MFGVHPIESDGISSNFFYMLAKENKKVMQSCRVACPPTVLFEQGFAKAFFSTESSKPDEPIGELKRKSGKDIDLQELFRLFTRNAVDGDIVAVLMAAAPRSNDLNNISFMDKADLHRFLFKDIEKPKSLLQRFVKPKGANNTLIHAVWSPLMVLCEGRRNTHSLEDRHLHVSVRGNTFEDRSQPSVEVVVASAVVKDITQACRTVAEHFERTERMPLNRLAAFFKVDEKNCLQLLSSTSIRVQDADTGKNHAPLNLGLGIKPARPKSGNIVEGGRGGPKPPPQPDDDSDEDAAFLREADRRTKRSLRVSIPSMPDNASLIHRSIHEGKGAPIVSVEMMERKRKQQQQQSSHLTSGVSSPGIRSPAQLKSPASVRSNTQFPVSRTPEPSWKAKTGANLHGQQITPPKTMVVAPQPQQQHVSSPPSVGGSKTYSGQSSRIATPQTFVRPANTGGARELVLSPNAILPQPKQLLKFQHLLPNSQHNVENAQRLAELGMTENEVREDWDTFLAEQHRAISKIRAAEHEKAKRKQQTALDRDAQRDRQAMANLDSTPPVKQRTAFDAQGKKEQSPTKSVLSQQPAQESPSAATTTPTKGTMGGKPDPYANINAPQVDLSEKTKYMQVMEAQMYANARGGTASPNPQSLMNDAMDEEDANTGLERFNMPQIPMPFASPKSLTRSVLLPPVFQQHQKTSKPSSQQSRRSTTPGGDSSRRGEAKATSSPSSHQPPKQSVLVFEQQQQQQPPPASSKTNKIMSPPKSNNNHSPTSSSSKKKTQPKTGSPVVPTVDVRASVGGGMTPPSQSPSALDSPARLTPKNKRVQEGGTPPPRAASPSEDLRHRRSKLPEDGVRSAELLFRELSDADKELVEERCQAKVEAFKTYTNELLYALYCYFLNATSLAALVAIPEAFEGIATPQMLAQIFHKLHGTVGSQCEFLSQLPEAVAAAATNSSHDYLTNLRQQYVDKLHTGALAEFQPRNVGCDADIRQAAAQDHPDDRVLLIHPFPNRFMVLKGEYSNADEEVEPYVAAPDGVFLLRAKERLTYERLKELEGEAAVAERMRAAAEAAEVNHDEDARDSQDEDEESVTTGRFQSEVDGEQLDATTNLAAMAEAQHTEMAYCTRCQACKTCCVCSMVFRGSRRR